jgi:hypothetical protein
MDGRAPAGESVDTYRDRRVSPDRGGTVTSCPATRPHGITALCLAGAVLVAVSLAESLAVARTAAPVLRVFGILGVALHAGAYVVLFGCWHRERWAWRAGLGLGAVGIGVAIVAATFDPTYFLRAAFLCAVVAYLLTARPFFR